MHVSIADGETCQVDFRKTIIVIVARLLVLWLRCEHGGDGFPRCAALQLALGSVALYLRLRPRLAVAVPASC
jgi:hypothetical protein